MKSKISRRSFLRNIAAAGSGAAALGLLAGCSSSSTAASSGSTAAAEDKYTPGTYSASKTISYSEIGVSMTFDANSITACEITSSGEQDLLTDDKKTAMAKAIVEGQSADVDAVTSCTLVASVGAIQECVADCILIKNSFRKFYRIELLQILDPFSYTDKLDRHIKLIRYRNDDATLGSTVQLR